MVHTWPSYWRKSADNQGLITVWSMLYIVAPIWRELSNSTSNGNMVIYNNQYSILHKQITKHSEISESIQSSFFSSEDANMFSWRVLSISVSPLSAHHKMMLMPKRLMGRTFHQGRSNWLPSEVSTFQVLWLALLLENLIGSSFPLLSSLGLADSRELSVRNRILVNLGTKKWTQVL